MKHLMRLVAVLLAGAIMGGCGDDGDDGTAGEGAAGAASTTVTSTTAATGTPVKVMVVSSENSSFYNAPDNWDVARAYAKMINAKGGLNGHPLEVVACNDQADANRALRCARQAASDKVVALVGGISVFGDQVFPVLERAGIPWIGNLAVTSGDYTSKVSYPWNSSAAFYTQLGTLMATECDRPVAIAIDTPTSHDQLENWTTPALEAGGGKFAKVVYVKVGVSDYTPALSQLKSADPDCVFGLLTTEEHKRFLSRMPQMLPGVRYVAHTNQFTPEVVEAAPQASEGALVSGTLPAPSNALWSEATKAIEQHAEKPDEVRYATSGPTWVALTLLSNVVDGMSGDITSEGLVKALGEATKVETGGFAPPIDFTTQNDDVPGYPRLFGLSAWQSTVQDGEFVDVSEQPVDMMETFAEIEKSGK